MLKLVAKPLRMLSAASSPGPVSVVHVERSWTTCLVRHIASPFTTPLGKDHTENVVTLDTTFLRLKQCQYRLEVSY